MPLYKNGLPPVNKIDPTFENSWINYGGATAPLKYWRDSMGYVHIVVVVKDGVTNVAIFTLPVGFRPLYNFHTPCTSNTAFANVRINSDGTVNMSVGNNAWLAINITFLPEQ